MGGERGYEPSVEETRLSEVFFASLRVAMPGELERIEDIPQCEIIGKALEHAMSHEKQDQLFLPDDVTGYNPLARMISLIADREGQIQLTEPDTPSRFLMSEGSAHTILRSAYGEIHNFATYKTISDGAVAYLMRNGRHIT